MLNLRQHKDIVYSKDLSSLQIWNVLNNMLYDICSPLVVYGEMAIETAISCLVLSTNNRRKITINKPTELLTDLYFELIQSINSKDEVLDLEFFVTLQNRGIERNIFTDHIAFSLKHGKFPEKIDKQKLYRHVTLGLEDYSQFMRDVIFRYYHFIDRESAKNYHIKSLHGLKSTPTDMLNVYMISAIHALNRFYPHRGTLTKNIQNWFQNAEGSSDYMVYDNEAFSLNRAVRKKIYDGEKLINNSAIPIADRENTISNIVDDSPSADENSYFDEFSRHIARLPNSTIVFLAQGLPYTLSPAQKERIRVHNQLQVK